MKPKEEGQSISLGPLLSTIKNWIKAKNNDIVKALIGYPKSTPRFPELMHASVFYGNLEMVKHLESQGCSLTAVPKTIANQENEKPDECAVKYRETPYLILAASKGHVYLKNLISFRDIVDYLLEKGMSLNTKGHIGFSPKKKNSIVSNAWGAAAYNSSLTMLESLLNKSSDEAFKELKAEEKKCGQGSLQKEVVGFTPLMLAVMAGDKNLSVVAWLIQEGGCKTNVIDWQGNSLLHIAVKCNCPNILKFLLFNTTIDPFQRNNDGETASSMANALGNQDMISALAGCKDNSGQKVYFILSNSRWMSY